MKTRKLLEQNINANTRDIPDIKYDLNLHHLTIDHLPFCICNILKDNINFIISAINTAIDIT